MRVITGFAKGRKLNTLPGKDEVRPTIDRVKEGIFNAIQYDIPDAVFLDLFAGSGQIGIEALSRGAKQGIFIDSNKTAIKIITENLEFTRLSEKAKIVSMDFSVYLSSTPDKFDIAFLDPPFHKGIIPKAMNTLISKMNPNGIIVCEHAIDERFSKNYGDFSIYKEYKYGKIVVTIYKIIKNDD